MMLPAAADRTIPQCIAAYAAASPQGVFCIAPESNLQVTWAALAQKIKPVSALATSLGVPPGAPLAYLLGNGWAAVQMALGVMCSGRVALPLNLAAGDLQLAHALRQSGCKAVVTDEENLPRLQELLREQLSDADINYVVVGRDEGLTDTTAATSPPPPAPKPDDAALLMYTSGTTGLPKGVVHTHRSMLAGGENVVTAHQLGSADRALCVLPLYHINGLCVTVMAPLLSGGGVVIPHRFSSAAFWHWVAQHECTWFSLVPTLIAYLLQGDDPPPLPQLRFGRSASAPLSPAVHERFEQRFGIPMIETMGLTETAAQILSNPLPPAVRKIGSPGIAVGNAVAVLNTAGKPCADGESGELAVRGENVMRGYYNNAAATAETFTEDGWLWTGDLGYRDADGYFFITGRRKELIIKGGENIAPREIDEALLQLPQVADAAAFARPCEQYGQRVEACVILSNGAAASEEVLLAHCHKVVGAFKSPDRIYFVADLPRGASGKVQRLKLPEWVACAGAATSA